MLDPTTTNVMVIDAANAGEYRYGLSSGGGFFVRPMELKPGARHKGHDHDIDHIGNLASGHARLHWRDPETGASGTVDMQVPSRVLVRARVWHEIEAVTDVLWECWFARAEAEALVDPYAREHYYFERRER